MFIYLCFYRSLIQGAIATIKRAVKKKGANDIDVSIFLSKINYKKNDFGKMYKGLSSI